MTTRVVHERKVRREIANSNERKRMQSINAGFQSLRLLLPRTGAVDRLSKVSELSLSVFFCLLPPINFAVRPCVRDRLLQVFLLLSIPFLSTRIVPLRFQAGGRRKRPNLGLVCFVCVIYLYSLV